MAFRPSKEILESDIKSAIDSGNKTDEEVGAKSLAMASSQNILAGNGAERVKKNKTTTVAMMVAILFHSIGSFMEDPAFAGPSFGVIVCKVLSVRFYLSSPRIFSGLQGKLRILTPVAL